MNHKLSTINHQLVEIEKPKVIFLDAVGTLFGIKGTVGEIYSKIAQQMGVKVDAKSLDQAFIQSFTASPPPAFPGVQLKLIPKYEFLWWKAIVKQTFTLVSAIDLFSDFNAAFYHLYHYFATANPWYVYPDVTEVLQTWQKEKMELGIISNFDTRLYKVLEALNLKQYFQSVTISSLAGAAKPEAEIFTTALAKHQCHPQDAWHIGDSLNDDYHGAQGVGIKPFLIKR